MSDFFGFVAVISIVFLFLGLIDPSVLKFLFRRSLSRKKIALIFICLLLLSGIIAADTAPSQPTTKTQQAGATTQQTNQSSQAAAQDNSAPTATPKPLTIDDKLWQA